MRKDEGHSTEEVQAQTVTEKLVDAARATWVDRLIDTSRRNNLLFFGPSLAAALRSKRGILIF